MFTNEYADKKAEVKQLLESVAFMKQAVEVKKQVLDDLMAMAGAAELHGAGMDTLLQQRIAKLRDEFLQDINALLVLQTRIKRGVAKIADERVRTIFEAKYLKGLTWEDIADLMCYSVIHVKRLANQWYPAVSRSIFSDAVSYT